MIYKYKYNNNKNFHSILSNLEKSIWIINNIYLPIPNDPESFCKRAYKDDYMDVFYINIPHPFNYIKNIIDGIGINSISNEKFYIKDLIE